MLKAALLAIVLLAIMLLACMAVGHSLFGANALRAGVTDRFDPGATDRFTCEFHGKFLREVIPC